VEEVTEEWRRMHSEKLHDLQSSPDIDHINNDVIGGACGIYRVDARCVQGFVGET
jgi:hypothetical protein